MALKLFIESILFKLQSFRSTQGFTSMLNILGVKIDSASITASPYIQFANIESLISESQDPDLLDIVFSLNELILQIRTTVQTINELISETDNNSSIQVLRDDLLGFILIDSLKSSNSRLWSLFNFLGVLEYNYIERETLIYKSYTKRSFNFGNLKLLISQPNNLFLSEFFWGSNEFLEYEKLFSKLQSIFHAYSIKSNLRSPRASYFDFHLEGIFNDDRRPLSLNIPIYNDVYNDAYGSSWVNLGVDLNAIPFDTQNYLSGLMLSPYVYGEKKLEFSKGQWNTSVELVLLGEIGLQVYPDSFEVHGEGSSVLKVRTLAYDINTYLLKIRNGQGLSVKDIALNFQLVLQNEYGFSLSLILEELKLSVNGNGSDSFLSSILPLNDIENVFNFEIAYSLQNGFSIVGGGGGGGGGGGFKYELPVDKQIGPVLLTRTILGLEFTSDEIQAYGAIEFRANLGPLEITVSEIGIYGTLLPDTPGLLGNADINFGLKPPTGLGLSIDAPTIKGGGFITFDAPDYYGILNLEIQNTIKVTAIGLISTGDRDFSMFIQIFGEFTPVQIGFGFTLSGIGGLFAYNRTIDIPSLRTTFLNGQLGMLLFPEDPMSDASTIISNVQSIFPASQGSYAFGLMGKFEWGTPPLVEFSIGVIIEFGENLRFVILGTGHSTLPDKNTPIAILNLDMFGVIDIQAEYLSVEASLFDSRLSEFSLSGGMALYSSWGSKPDFILSIGGFHSRYKLTTDRIAVPERVGLSKTGDFWVFKMETFIAITSNTFQLGAAAHISARKKGYRAVANAGFEALIIFNPFSFEVDIFFDIKLYKGSKNKGSLDLDINLKGPNPYKLHGILTVEFWFIDFEIEIRKTFGETKIQEVGESSPLIMLKEALRRPQAVQYDNPIWQSTNKKTKTKARKKLKEQESVAHDYLDAGGTVVISQSAIPLNVELEHIGGNTIKTGESQLTFNANDQSISENNAVDAKFAPAQFMKLSESDKLSSEGFVNYNAGIKIKPTYQHGVAVVEPSGFENVYDGDEAQECPVLTIQIFGAEWFTMTENDHLNTATRDYSAHKNFISFSSPEETIQESFDANVFRTVKDRQDALLARRSNQEEILI